MPCTLHGRPTARPRTVGRLRTRTARLRTALLSGLVLLAWAGGAPAAISKQDGDWHDPETWVDKIMPGNSALIRHEVGVGRLTETGGIGVAGTLSVSGGSEGGLVVGQISVGLYGEGPGMLTVTGDPLVTSLRHTGSLLIGHSHNGAMEVWSGRVQVDSAINVGLNLQLVPYVDVPPLTGSLLINGSDSVVSALSVSLGTFSAYRQGIGTGTLVVENGATLDASLGVRRGEATLRGPGTLWRSASAEVRGTLRLLDGVLADGGTVGGLAVRSGGDQGDDTDSGRILISGPLTQYRGRDFSIEPRVPVPGLDYHLEIDQVAMVSGSNAYIRHLGSVRVGGGGLWALTGNIQMTNSNGSRFHIDSGGVVTAGSMTGSSVPEVPGVDLRVHGAGSSLVLSGALHLRGPTVTHRIDIGAGAQVQAGSLQLGDAGTGGGFESRGRSRVDVHGPGSRLSVGGAVVLGRHDGATLRVAEAAVAALGSVQLGTTEPPGYARQSEGVLEIGAPLGQAAEAPGFVEVPGGISLGRTGVLRFNHDATGDTRLVFGAALRSTSAGYGRLDHYAGDTVLTGGNAAFTGITQVHGGRLFVDGTLGSGSVIVEDGAALGGSGTLLGTLVARPGATILPGSSPGRLAVQGDLQLGDGARLVMEIGGLVAGVSHDVIDIGGDALLGDGTLVLSFVDGWAPAAGQPYALAQVGGSFVLPAAVEVQGLMPGWNFELGFDANGGLNLHSLSAGIPLPAVPAPPSAWMLAAGLLALGGWKRRRSVAVASAP